MGDLPPEDRQQQTPQDEGNKNKIEERINKLYGQKKEAEEYSANLESENQTLRTQMLELQETVNNLKERKDDGQTTQAGQSSSNGNAGNLDAEGIRKVVEETVGSVLSTREQNSQKAAQLRNAQVQSWQKAVHEIPGLKDQNSDIYQAAQRIWERDTELKQSPSGPFKAAILARGFLGNDGVSTEQLNSVTQQSTISNNLSDGNTKGQLKAIEEEIAEVKVEMASGKPITRTWPRYQALKQKRAELLGKADKNK